MLSYKRGWLVIPLALVAIFVTGLIVPYTYFTETASLQRPVDEWLLKQEPGSALIEYPWSERSKLALFGQTLHGQPIVNGYAPHLPKFLEDASAVTQANPTQEGVDTLLAWGVRYLLLTRPAFDNDQDELLDQIKAYEHLCLVESFPIAASGEGYTYVFEISGRSNGCPAG